MNSQIFSEFVAEGMKGDKNIVILKEINGPTNFVNGSLADMQPSQIGSGDVEIYSGKTLDWAKVETLPTTQSVIAVFKGVSFQLAEILEGVISNIKKSGKEITQGRIVNGMIKTTESMN